MLLKLAGSLISGITQKISADRKRKKAIKELDNTKKSLNEAYYKESSQDYLDSGEGLSSVKLLGDQKKTSDEALANSVIKSGATAEAEVAKAAAVNKNYADAVNRLAVVGMKQKEALKNKHESNIAQIEDQKRELRGERKSIMSYVNF